VLRAITHLNLIHVIYTLSAKIPAIVINTLNQSIFIHDLSSGWLLTGDKQTKGLKTSTELSYTASFFIDVFVLILLFVSF